MILPAPLRPMMPTHLAALDLEADVLQRPELLDLVALDELPAAQHVARRAREALNVARHDVAQRDVALGSAWWPMR